MLIEVLQPDFVFEDNRGQLTQLVHNGYSQINVIRSVADCIRGNHYHKINDEVFFVISGLLKLTVSLDRCEETYYFKENDMFKIPANVIHSFSFEQETLLVSMYSLGVELQGGGKDIFS